MLRPPNRWYMKVCTLCCLGIRSLQVELCLENGTSDSALPWSLTIMAWDCMLCGENRLVFDRTVGSKGTPLSVWASLTTAKVLFLKTLTAVTGTFLAGLGLVDEDVCGEECRTGCSDSGSVGCVGEDETPVADDCRVVDYGNGECTLVRCAGSVLEYCDGRSGVADGSGTAGGAPVGGGDFVEYGVGSECVGRNCDGSVGAAVECSLDEEVVCACGSGECGYGLLP